MASRIKARLPDEVSEAHQAKLARRQEKLRTMTPAQRKNWVENADNAQLRKAVLFLLETVLAGD